MKNYDDVTNAKKKILRNNSTDTHVIMRNFLNLQFAFGIYNILTYNYTLELLHTNS